MAEQETTVVMPPVGASSRRRQPSSHPVQVQSHTMSSTEPMDRMRSASYPGRPTATGFTSNQRPAVYYKPSLDLTDNPQLGLLLSDSLVSETKQSYQPPVSSDRSGSLPSLINQHRDSGFHQLRALSKPGPAEDKTEYQSLYVPHPLTPSAGLNYRTVGKKEATGFTEGTDLQLNTFQQKHIGALKARQTSPSVMKSDFTPPSPLQVGLRWYVTPSLSRETGFTRGTVAPLAHPSSILPPHQTRSSAPTVTIVGKKELTGFISNTPKDEVFPKTPFDSSYFTTHYRSKFCHHGDLTKLRSVPTAGIITNKMENSYNRRASDRFILKTSLM